MGGGKGAVIFHFSRSTHSQKIKQTINRNNTKPPPKKQWMEKETTRYARGKWAKLGERLSYDH